MVRKQKSNNQSYVSNKFLVTIDKSVKYVGRHIFQALYRYILSVYRSSVFFLKKGRNRPVIPDLKNGTYVLCMHFETYLRSKSSFKKLQPVKLDRIISEVAILFLHTSVFTKYSFNYHNISLGKVHNYFFKKQVHKTKHIT